MNTDDMNNDSKIQHPDPEMLESGDFVWAKMPNATVLYDAPPDDLFDRNAEGISERQWYAEREKFLISEKNASTDKPFQRRSIEVIEKMDFRQFVREYAGNEVAARIPDREPESFFRDVIYIGHVGIVSASAGQISIVEATMHPSGVYEVPYSEWINRRSDQSVWVGRLSAESSIRRDAIAQSAREEVKKPYDFWNFDLDDDSNFYCSKLAWFCTFNALKIAIDGNINPKRSIWFSPKQMIHCQGLDILFNDPAKY